jgi:hypothetical protein
MNTFTVNTPCAGSCILEPLGDGQHVRLHWDGKPQYETRESITWEQHLLQRYASDWLIAEGFIAFAAGKIQLDAEVQKYFSDID